MNKGIFLSLLHFAQVLSQSCVSLLIVECICKFQDVWFLWVEWDECGGLKEEKKKRSLEPIKFLVPHEYLLSQVLLFEHTQEKIFRMKRLL